MNGSLGSELSPTAGAAAFCPAGSPISPLEALRRPGSSNQISSGTGRPRWQVQQVTPVSATWLFHVLFTSRVICSIRRATTLV